MFKTILTGVLALIVGAALAQHPNHPGRSPKSLAKTKPTVKVSAPKAFVCVHCGRRIALKSNAELKKTCAVCACGTTNAACKPAKKGR